MTGQPLQQWVKSLPVHYLPHENWREEYTRRTGNTAQVVDMVYYHRFITHGPISSGNSSSIQLESKVRRFTEAELRDAGVEAVVLFSTLLNEPTRNPKGSHQEYSGYCIKNRK